MTTTIEAQLQCAVEDLENYILKSTSGHDRELDSILFQLESILHEFDKHEEKC